MLTSPDAEPEVTLSDARLSVLLEGVDLGDRTAWAWEWTQPEWVGGFRMLSHEELLPVLAALEEALPSSSVRRSLRGAFSHPTSEAALMGLLGTLLLPDPLWDQIRKLSEQGKEVEVVVLPAENCATVPWELLHRGDPEQRLLDVAVVRTVAPIVSRDLAGFRPTEAASGVPLLVVDPELDVDPDRRTAEDDDRAVLGAAGRKRWQERAESMPDGRHAVIGDRFRRGDLRRALAQGPSRLTYVGHVVSARGDSAIRLTDGRVHASQMLEPTAEGEQLRMPPRVAWVACSSGTDWAESEAFGLVAAALELGAELVVATRWPLPTDAAFAEVSADGLPFTRASLEIDAVLADDDPERAFAAWQRERLGEWRASTRDSVSVGASPLAWGAFSLFRSRARSGR